MSFEINFKKWLLIGVLVEGMILAYANSITHEPGEVFRLAARYSGRLSLLVYLFVFYIFSSTCHKPNSIRIDNLKKLVTIFCTLHFIHFGFLALNVYLNDITLVSYKLAGGFLAYALILLYPFYINKVKQNHFIHFIYFYYVGIVMALTYVARIKGEFEGAAPSTFHYLGLSAVLLSFIVFTYLIISKRKQTHIG